MNTDPAESQPKASPARLSVAAAKVRRDLHCTIRWPGSMYRQEVSVEPIAIWLAESERLEDLDHDPDAWDPLQVQQSIEAIARAARDLTQALYQKPHPEEPDPEDQ